MTDDPRIERVVRAWLDASDPPRSADYVAESVLAAVPSIGQDSVVGAGRLIVRFRDAALAAAGLALAVLLAFLVYRPDPGPAATPEGSPAASPSPTVTRSPRPTPTPTPAPTVTPTLPPGVIAIDLGAATWSLAVDDRSVWVNVEPDGMKRIDRATNTDSGAFVDRVQSMVFAGPDLWAIGDDTGILRVDPISGEILETLPGIVGFYIAVDGTTAWVTDVFESVVRRVDLEAGEVIATIDVPNEPKEVILFDGDVWVTCDDGWAVARIDPSTNAVVAEIPARVRPTNLSAGEGAVWVWNHSQELLRIDPATNAVVATIEPVAPPIGSGVTVGGGYVWAAVPGGIGQIDPATNQIINVLSLPLGELTDLVWFEGELWSSSIDADAVYRIDTVGD